MNRIYFDMCSIPYVGRGESARLSKSKLLIPLEAINTKKSKYIMHIESMSLLIGPYLGQSETIYCKVWPKNIIWIELKLSFLLITCIITEKRAINQKRTLSKPYC